MLQRLPAGADEAPRIAALAAQAQTLARAAAAQRAQGVPRPEPPQYAALQVQYQRAVVIGSASGCCMCRHSLLHAISAVCCMEVQIRSCACTQPSVFYLHCKTPAGHAA